jgi:hypothetical protein
MQQTYADQPGQLTGIFEGGGHEDPQQVDEDQDHHQRCTPMVDAADEPAKGDAIHDVGDTVVGVIRRGGIVNRQEDAGRSLQQEQKQAGRAERIPPVAFRLRAVEDVGVKAVQAETLVQPEIHFIEHIRPP